MTQAVVIHGERYGRLLVLGESHVRTSDGRRQVRCQCDCGELTSVRVADLRAGRQKSCGCKRKDSSRRRGGEPHPLYYTWRGIRQRCRNPHNKYYHRYGGRGIALCPRWDDFLAFVEDVGPKPGPGYSLDRIDNDGDYEPGNVRWATRQEQEANKRVSVGT